MNEPNTNTLAIPDAASDQKFSITETGITFDADCSFEDWQLLGTRLARIGRSVGLLIGDWINHGETHYGEKYKQALAETRFDYQTLRNFAYVSRKIEMSCRQDKLAFEHHLTVAKLKPEEQKKWLELAAKEKLGYRRLRKSINFGRVATEEEMKADPADKGQTFYTLFVNRLCQWFAKRTERDPVSGWPQELKDMLRRDLKPIVDIYNAAK